jgi:hypothetical protein
MTEIEVRGALEGRTPLSLHIGTEPSGLPVVVIKVTDQAVCFRPIAGGFRPWVWFPLKALRGMTGDRVEVAWWMRKQLSSNQKYVLGLR